MRDDAWAVLKVMAYITRESGIRRELLVFRHRDYADAGLQVPAGTVMEGESIEAALYREVAEETGLTVLEFISKVGVFTHKDRSSGQQHERHVFHLRAPSNTPDSWEWLETGGDEVADSEGFVFQFSWADLSAISDLAGNQGEYLGLIGD